MPLALAFLPSGHLHAFDRVEEPAFADARLETRLRDAFSVSAGRGLLTLGGTEPTALPPAFRWAREMTVRYLTRLCHTADLDAAHWPELPPPAEQDRAEVLAALPPLTGLEYARDEAVTELWRVLDETTRDAARQFAGTAQEFLVSIHPDWRLVGRVTFHLAENKRDPEKPFAFLATYTEKLSATAKPQYLPLSRALAQYAESDRRDALLSLLTPVQRAALKSPLVKELVDSAAIYRPLAWTPKDAFRFLQDIPLCEQAGVLVRVPDWWKGGRPSRPKISVEVGAKPAVGGVGISAMLDFSARATLDGVEITPDEWKALLAGTSGLVSLRGQWVEIDREKLSEALSFFRKIERHAGEGVNFAEAMRWLAGGGGAFAGVEAPPAEAVREWIGVTAGPWLEKTLAALRDPAALAQALPLAGLNAELRPYQQSGVQWLWFMMQLGLGACLADDMGLGKTLQTIAVLLALKGNTRKRAAAPSLLIAPASLLGNWRAEMERFAPSLRFRVLHSSEMPAEEISACEKDARRFSDADLIITTYGLATRLTWLAERSWNVLLLDEAQAIKNPTTRQTLAVKKIPAERRIALTGTPVENKLQDLWSIFDFLNPGLLGTSTAFSDYAARCAADSTAGYAPLRALVRPYILRRLKTDRSVIADLPDKTELSAYCALAPEQAALYRKAVQDLVVDLKAVGDPMKRRGLVLAYLQRFKQICNHPSHWLGDGVFAPDASGKYARLRELVEEFAERQERALVFTQFREMTAPLADFLGTLYGRPGLILHGGTPVGQRRKLVEEFQREDGPPFFVLSLKAGGTGLNLTAASQVIHFDRWWNPAVENQATDRAFRIGQTKNVLVHKFVCRGTLEERIDTLIASKRDLADALLGGGAEKALTEMSDAELVSFVSLDIARAGGG